MVRFWVWLNYPLQISQTLTGLSVSLTLKMRSLRYCLCENDRQRVRERDCSAYRTQCHPPRRGVVPLTWGLPSIRWHSHLCKTQLPATLTALCVILGPEVIITGSAESQYVHINTQRVSILSLNTFCYKVTVPFYAPTLMHTLIAITHFRWSSGAWLLRVCQWPTLLWCL